MKLGAKFSRKLLYTWQDAIGIGLLQPHTIIAMAIVRQHIRNVRLQQNVDKRIIVLEEILVIESGYTILLMKLKQVSNIRNKGELIV